MNILKQDSNKIKSNILRKSAYIFRLWPTEADWVQSFSNGLLTGGDLQGDAKRRVPLPNIEGELDESVRAIV